MIPHKDRMVAIGLIDEAVLAGARRRKACDVLEISERTYHRWYSNSTGDKRKGAAKSVPRRLTDEEEERILTVAGLPRFRDLNPYQIVAILLDEGTYIASESTFYRVLKRHDMIHHRKRGRRGIKQNKPPQLLANGPNQVWSWDITYLKTKVNGIFLYAYVIVDVWSRKIVGWEVHEKESPDIAEEMFIRLRNRYKLKGIRLHSDNGNPMKGGTMIMTLYQLGVIPSFSRPRVSDDNPYSEALFKTLKYTAGYPKCFENVKHARKWLAGFVDWYNVKHRHSQIGYITPSERHDGMGFLIMDKRNTVMKAVRKENPQRWSRPRKIWRTPEIVFLNPEGNAA